MGVTVSASGARGKSDGQDLTYSNTRIEAGNTVRLQSGGDTTLKGAVVAGKSVKADIGGNLSIESLQDTSVYASKQASVGGSVTVGAGVSGSVSASSSKSNSNYASVAEQSGIQAGDGGFAVNVKGNTDLRGGVIASTEQAANEGRNRLTTATLTTSDIQNKAEASASSSGINLSSDMLSQGKYGAAKAVMGNALGSASESGSSSGQTRSAVSAGAVTITDEAAQQAKTGKTGQETVASLNRDTASAQTAAVKQNVQAMQQTVEAERAIKQAAVAEAVKFSDEAYRKLFIAKHPMYEVVKDENGKTVIDEKTNKPVLRELSEQEKTNLQPGPDGKVHIAANGIFNDKDAAGAYANQHGNTTGPQYVIYFPEANDGVSELMIAGYQKYIESNAMGLSNSTLQVRDAMNQYGQIGLQLDGHSRGAMTIGNGLESQTASPNAQGSLSNTKINFFGPAYNAQQADNLLSTLQDRASLPVALQPSLVLQLQNHAADPVGVLVGGNQSTGGTIPEGSSPIKEAFKAVTMQPTTVHNCYGVSNKEECGKLWGETGGYPSPVPALGVRR
jgi:filamentous hemagglutinin